MRDIAANFKLKEPSSLAPTLIYMKAYFNRNRFTYSTGKKISPAFWHEGTQRPITYRLEQVKKEIKTNPGADLRAEQRELEDRIRKGIKENPTFVLEMKNLASELNRFEDELIIAYQYLARQKEEITPARLRELLDKDRNQKAIKPERNSFFDRFDEYTEHKKQTNSILTVRKYNTLKERLTEFEKENHYKLSFDSIDLIFYDRFYKFLINYDNSRIQGLTGLLNDTVSKYISALKAFMQWAFDRNYHQNTAYQHKQFSSKKIAKNEIVTLTEAEIIALRDHDFSNQPSLERVRDLFCFAFYTGQRWSDIEQFKKEDLKGDAWDFISVKTKKRIKVPLIGFTSPALEILKKNNYVLPLLSQQRFNDYIKKAGFKAGLNEDIVIKRLSGKRIIEIKKPKYAFISSHMARRSCVTILLQKGVPPTTVMKLTGHSDLKTLMKYENTSFNELVKALETVSNK